MIGRVEVDVARTRVVILSGQSLFAEGVASRLRQHLDRLELVVIDSRESDALQQVLDARPSTLILDAADVMDITQNCPLGDLMRALQPFKIIRLDSQQQAIRILTSEQRLADEVKDLIELIEPPKKRQPKS